MKVAGTLGSYLEMNSSMFLKWRFSMRPNSGLEMASPDVAGTL